MSGDEMEVNEMVNHLTQIEHYITEGHHAGRHQLTPEQADAIRGVVQRLNVVLEEVGD